MARALSDETKLVTVDVTACACVYEYYKTTVTIPIPINSDKETEKDWVDDYAADIDWNEALDI